MPTFPDFDGTGNSRRKDSTEPFADLPLEPVAHEGAMIPRSAGDAEFVGLARRFLPDDFLEQTRFVGELAVPH